MSEQEDLLKNLEKKKKASNPASPGRPPIVFESGIIRLNQADFDKWKAAYKHIDLEPHLLSITPWATGLGKAKWFHAVQNALKNANQKAKERAQQHRVNGEPDPDDISSYWHKSI